jgi:formylmethanofuran dehydrogenase subunit C
MELGKKNGRRQQADASMTAAKRFGKYRDESQKDAREVSVGSDAVNRILGIWKEETVGSSAFLDINYRYVTEAISGVEYTSEDLTRFCLMLTDFQDETGFGDKAGLFLSALINEGKDAEYVINVEHLPGQIDHFGVENRKRVTVIGDLGDYAGDSMEEGTLTVKGNVGNRAGFIMKGGELRIEGSADDSLGDSMTGGRITVTESCGNELGDKMEGGEIIIEGDVYGVIGYEMKGGSITVNGDMIRERSEKRMGEERFIGTAGVKMEGGEIHFNGKYYVRETNVINGKIFHKGKLVVDK